MQIVKRDLIGFCRDTVSLFFLVAFPILLVFLLGNLLAEMDEAERGIGSITLAYTIEAGGETAQGAEAFLQGLEESGYVTAVAYPSYEAAQAAVNEGTASAAVVFREPLAIELYQGFEATQNRAVGIMLAGFARTAGVLQTLALEAPAQLPAALTASAEGLVAELQLPYNRTMMDYYAVAMLVMILFMGGALSTSSTLYDGRRDGTLQRLAASPKNRASIYVQTVLASVPQTLVQVLAIMLTSTLFFGARYAATLPQNLLLFFGLALVGLAVNGVSALAGFALPFNPMMPLMAVLWTMMFVSGTFSRAIHIKGFTEAMPVWQVQNAAFDLTVYGRPEKMIVTVLISAVVLAVSTVAGALLFRRKGLGT